MAPDQRVAPDQDMYGARSGQALDLAPSYGRHYGIPCPGDALDQALGPITARVSNPTSEQSEEATPHIRTRPEAGAQLRVQIPVILEVSGCDKPTIRAVVNVNVEPTEKIAVHPATSSPRSEPPHSLRL